MEHPGGARRLRLLPPTSQGNHCSKKSVLEQVVGDWAGVGGGALGVRAQGGVVHVVYTGVLGASGARSKCYWRRCGSCSITGLSVGAEGARLPLVEVCRLSPFRMFDGGAGAGVLVVGACTVTWL